MNIQIKKESDILGEGFRARVIEEIEANENNRRRQEMFKRYEVLKDQTDEWVRFTLEQQFDVQTVQEMLFARTNISFARKIVNKLARAYDHGVKRKLTKVKDTKNLEMWADLLKINRKMKKTDRYLRAFKNTVAYMRPIKVEENGKIKFDLSVRILPPYLYNAIENPNDREKPLVYILSPFVPARSSLFSMSPATEGRTPLGPSNSTSRQPRRGDGTDQTIADSPSDAGIKNNDKNSLEYIWWSKNHHFTTNSKGGVISKSEDGTKEMDNPIKTLPFVNWADSQDGQFWALGGNDIIDASIKLNCLLTHVVHVGVTQGYGQAFMTGKGLPKTVKTGPNKVIQLEYDKANNDPTPTFEFLTANAPLAELMDVMTTWVALLLSTNNLSTAGFSSQLNGASTFPSGIARLLDMAESMEEISDSQEIFRDLEPEVWGILQKFYDVYNEKKLLSERMLKTPFPENAAEVVVSFEQPQPIMSEGEKLDVLAKRKDLGINLMIELIQKDDPSLNVKDAEEKLKKILEEKMTRMQNAITEATKNGDKGDGSQGVESGDDGDDSDTQFGKPKSKETPES